MTEFDNWNSKQKRIVPSTTGRFHTLVDSERKRAWIAASKKSENFEIENKRLKEALRLAIDRWRLIGHDIWDTKVKVSILELERQLEKDVEQVLKGE